MPPWIPQEPKLVCEIPICAVICDSVISPIFWLIELLHELPIRQTLGHQDDLTPQQIDKGQSLAHKWSRDIISTPVTIKGNNSLIFPFCKWDFPMGVSSEREAGTARGLGETWRSRDEQVCPTDYSLDNWYANEIPSASNSIMTFPRIDNKSPAISPRLALPITSLLANAKTKRRCLVAQYLMTPWSTRRIRQEKLTHKT